MNALVMAVHARQAARGLGGWDVGDDGVPFYTPDGGSVGGSGGGSGFNWNNLVGTVGSTLSNIFGRNNNSSAQLSLLQQQQALAAAQAAAARNSSSADSSDDSGGVGISFSDKGLRLGSKTTISYPTLGLAALAIVLVQSSGFQKRGR